MPKRALDNDLARLMHKLYVDAEYSEQDEAELRERSTEVHRGELDVNYPFWRWRCSFDFLPDPLAYHLSRTGKVFTQQEAEQWLHRLRERPRAFVAALAQSCLAVCEMVRKKPQMTIDAAIRAVPAEDAQVYSRDTREAIAMLCALHLSRDAPTSYKPHGVLTHFPETRTVLADRRLQAVPSMYQIFESRFYLNAMCFYYSEVYEHGFYSPHHETTAVKGHDVALRMWHATMQHSLSCGLLRDAEVARLSRLQHWTWIEPLPNPIALRFGAQLLDAGHKTSHVLAWIAKRRALSQRSVRIRQHADRFLGRLIEYLSTEQGQQTETCRLLTEAYPQALREAHKLPVFTAEQEKAKWVMGTAGSAVRAVRDWSNACVVQVLRLRFAHRPESRTHQKLAADPNWQWHGTLQPQDFDSTLELFLFGDRHEQRQAHERYLAHLARK